MLTSKLVDARGQGDRKKEIKQLQGEMHEVAGAEMLMYQPKLRETKVIY